MCRSPESQALQGLLERIARRDEGALEALYASTSGKVYGYALRVLGDAHAAEEVTLDVYMQVWERAPRYSADRGSPLAWLVTMTRSRALDSLRSRRSRAAAELPEIEPRSSAASPLTKAGDDDEGERIDVAIAQLPAPQREAIEASFFRGRTHAQIAAALGVPLGTVKGRIRNGLLKLRTLLLEPLENME